MRRRPPRGLVIGGFIEGPLDLQGWSILTEGLLSMKGSKLEAADDARVRLTYFEVPVLARAAVSGPRNARLHLYAGPAFSLKLSESVSPETDDADEDDDLFRPFDVGLTFGGSVEIRHALVDIRYSLGLANIADEDDFDPSLRARSRTFSVLVGWRLR